jgi:hypothetical protein
MKYRPRSCYERSPQSFDGLRSDRSAAQPGRPPGLGRSSRNDASITDRANTRMGGAKRYPSIAVCEDDGFREELNPSYALVFHQLICPSGKKTFARENLSSRRGENISLRDCPKSNLQFSLSRTHKRGGSRSSRTLGAGCDGRTSPGAVVARRVAVVRTAKSCGLGAPMQALSLVGESCEMTVAKKHGHRREHV